MDLIAIKEMSDSKLADFMKENSITLKIDEARKITELIGRNPTLTELHIFNIEWSEHCSYKSSRDFLKLLPSKASTVILGPNEDAGILKLNDEYGIVIGHESHNHPSQLVPFEGAATGIGGIVRDIVCMGAKVIATADPLRFGIPNNKTKYIANSVIDGIASYGNAIGVPNIAGDVYFNSSFNDNCLVNVVSLGLIRNSEIIHSRAPDNAANYDIILVGKATDNSGFGGAAFASLMLDEAEANKSAVQVPDPFLKNVLLQASYEIFEKSRKKNITIGCKDCGAGGIMCATSELVEAGNMGAEIDLNSVHTSVELLPFVTACSETQERLVFISPPDFSQIILDTFNKDYELPNIAEKAKAAIIGKVRPDSKYILKYNGQEVCNIDVNIICKGIKSTRDFSEPDRQFFEPNLDEPDYNLKLLEVLRLPQIACKSACYEHYDSDVQGNTIFKPGMADAGVIAPLDGKPDAIALSVDSNPRYSRINPYLGAVNAVAEAMRNVAAIGANPVGLTDCLNYGNPEKPEQFWEFVQGVNGLSDAANKIMLKTEEPVPFVSGNVSFYNESLNNSVDPSAIVACVGVMEDYSKAITLQFRNTESFICIVGKRKNELGGSAYYETFGKLGKKVPIIDFRQEHGMIYGITELINERLILSCHDISDGGLITAITEMILGGHGKGNIGANIILHDDLRTDQLLFSESSGFVMEIEENKLVRVEEILLRNNIELIQIGKTINSSSLNVNHNNKEVINIEIEKLSEAWLNGFKEAIK